MKIKPGKPLTFQPREAGLVGPGGEALPVPRVAVGYPFGGGVTGPFLQSLLKLQTYELAKEQPLLRNLIPQGGLYIAQNRNRIVEKFLLTDAEWLVQIDSDIQFPAQIIEMLLSVAGRDKKIVAASVPLSYSDEYEKCLPSCGLMMTSTPGEWAYLTPDEIAPQGVAVDGIATAVVAIHREVFEGIAKQVGQCWFLHKNQPSMLTDAQRAAWEPDGDISERKYVSVGEDLAFCLRAKDAGYQSWVARMPGLRHFKTLPLSHDFEVITNEAVAQ